MGSGKKNNIFSSVFDRDTLLHLRISFSLFLLPVFLLGISQAGYIDIRHAILLFIGLHLFIYPGSNAYNSFMDKDTESIGGLKSPPVATRKLYYASMICDAIGLMLCLFIGWRYMLIALCYVLISKAYSWHGIRLKKYTYLSWLTVMTFQGGYTFMLVHMAVTDNATMQWFTAKNLECMAIASLIIGGSYPLTQIYQHTADSRRGDRTLSYMLGVRGTFIFTLVFFSAGGAVALYYFAKWYNVYHFLVFTLCLLPVLLYFLYWFAITIRDKTKADFEHTMRMNKISAVCMAVCFVALLVMNHPNMTW